MQQVEELHEIGAAEQQQVDKVVEVLSNLANHGENVAEIAHDARNMVTALDLYCDLFQEPGVLAAPFAHYSGELRLVAAASRRLVDKLDLDRDPDEAPDKARGRRSNGQSQLTRFGEEEQRRSNGKIFPQS